MKTLLYLHIITGALGLLAGTITMILRKGDARHRKTGLVFLYAMALSSLFALSLAVSRTNYFLFVVGIFTLYLILSGQAALHLQRRGVNGYDWLLSIGMLVFGALFVGFGGYILLQGQFFGSVLLVFGGIGTVLAFRDVQFYQGKIQDKKYLLKSHIGKMVGGNIAAFTAFLVVNNTILPGVVAWLLPTLIGTILISRWTRAYS
jgi:uncharacterized membrane protein